MVSLHVPARQVSPRSVGFEVSEVVTTVMRVFFRFLPSSAVFRELREQVSTPSHSFFGITGIAGITEYQSERAGFSNARALARGFICRSCTQLLRILSKDTSEMSERLTRKALYDLVWSKPMMSLSARFEIFDVALKKTCARQKSVRLSVAICARTTRRRSRRHSRYVFPALDDQVEIGAGGEYSY